MQVIPVSFVFCLAGARIFSIAWNLAVLLINIKNLDNKQKSWKISFIASFVNVCFVIATVQTLRICEHSIVTLVASLAND